MVISAELVTASLSCASRCCSCARLQFVAPAGQCGCGSPAPGPPRARRSASAARDSFFQEPGTRLARRRYPAPDGPTARAEFARQLGGLLDGLLRAAFARRPAVSSSARRARLAFLERLALARQHRGLALRMRNRCCRVRSQASRVWRSFSSATTAFFSASILLPSGFSVARPVVSAIARPHRPAPFPPRGSGFQFCRSCAPARESRAARPGGRRWSPCRRRPCDDGSARPSPSGSGSRDKRWPVVRRRHRLSTT